MTTKMVTCPQCNGNGRYTSDEAKGMVCDVCGGAGRITPREARAYSDRVDREMRAFMRSTR